MNTGVCRSTTGVMIDVTIQGKDCIFLMHAQEVADVHSRCGMEVMQLFIYYFDTYCKISM